MTISPKKLLIVDDFDLVRDFLQALFAPHGLEMEFASNGQEAVEVCAREEFSAILMDLDMPVMGGIEAARIIRRREREENRTPTPIFAVSGKIPSPHEKCIEAEMDGFITKPIDIEKILGTILPLVR